MSGNDSNLNITVIAWLEIIFVIYIYIHNYPWRLLQYKILKVVKLMAMCFQFLS